MEGVLGVKRSESGLLILAYETLRHRVLRFFAGVDFTLETLTGVQFLLIAIEVLEDRLGDAVSTL